MTKQKYLVYEVFTPTRKFLAVDASGLHGLMEGIAPESRVYSWYAEDAPSAVQAVESFLAARRTP